MAEPLRLPVEMTIYTAGDTASALRAWVQASASDADPLQIDGDAVAEIDGAGLQLLVALQHSLQRSGRTAEWRQPSPTLSRACRMLGAGAPFQDALQGAPA